MIGIICAGQIELSPFVKKYTKVFDDAGIKYEIIHWDRSGEERNDQEGMYTFTSSLDRYANKLQKLLPFIGFSKFVKRTVKERGYEKLVILTTQTAILIADLLLGKYKGKYFFDYRDTSYEYIKPYAAFVNKLADKSMGVAISSPGFKEYIKTKQNMVIAHNFQDENYEKREVVCKKKTDGRIVMGYIGVLREFEYLKKLVSDFGNDERFEFRIHGGGDDLDRLRQYSEQFSNVLVAGAYQEDEKRDIIDSFDMICYNYPMSFVNYPAVANKFYDGLIMKKPMFANSRTFSGRMIDKNGLGISIDENDSDVTEKIYNYYREFDADEFSSNCEVFLKTVLDDEKAYIKAIEGITV